MNTAADITVTRKAIAGGKAFRYDNVTTGEPVTKRSTRRYEYASAYRETAKGRWDSESGQWHYEPIPEAEQPVVVFLHARADLAAKGSPDGNRIPSFARLPGVITIEEAS